MRPIFARQTRTPLLILGTMLTIGQIGCVGELSGGPIEAVDGSVPLVDSARLDVPGTDLGPPVMIDGGECMDASDCPDPPVCMQAATCASGRCNYAPSTAGTSCGTSTGCAVFSCNGLGVCDMASALCNDPPVTTVPTSCPAGTTFMAPLGGACGGACNPSSGACEYAMVEVACPPSGANHLPTAFAWQAKLREYLASLTAADFTEPAATQILYSSSGPEGSADARDQFGWWLAARALSGASATFPYTGLPDTFEIMPAEFTLAQIEQSPPRVKVGWKGGVPTDYAAWLSHWSFPGNGFNGSKAEFLRAFAFSSGDLMLTAKRYISDSRRDIWIWPALPYHGYVGLVAHQGHFLESSILEQCAMAVYDVGTRALLEKAGAFAPSWGSDPNGDMVAMGIRGLAYMGQSLGDAEAIEIAHLAAADLIEDNASPAGGYWNHFNCDGCYDAQYEGTTLIAIREAAIASGWPEVRANVERLLHTIAYTSLPEPGGQLYGPSHFSPATADPSSYSFSYPREQLPNFEFGDDGLYALFTSVQGTATTWPTQAEMRTDLANWFDGITASATMSFDAANQGWDATDHYSYGMSNFVQYRAEWYDRLAELIAAPTDPRRLPPFARSGNFIEQIGEDFVSAKIGNAGLIIHTGNVSGDAEPHGFGGGELSAFWTAEGGSAILGWSRGGQNPKPNSWSGSNGWDGFRNHLAHAVVGVKDGQPFSSARLPSVTHTNTVSSGTAMVSVSGNLNSNQSDPGNVLTAALSYARTFEVGMAAASDGVRITTTLGALPSGVTELYEVLPIFDHGYSQRPAGESSEHCPPTTRAWRWR
ncbi:MAG: hypothetical protein IPK60_06435 [Sandaracinaceae bacterium]|nr:hypothetical protein [Sandaracinaceae bacterium]